VDVELLWQSVGTRQRELNPSELAELFFAETTPETESAVFRELSEDNLFFRRKGAQFLPKTEEQVLSERTRRQRQRAREEFREHVVKVLEQLLKKNTDIPEESGVILDRIQNWLRFKTGDEIGLILEEIAGAAKARDAAYDILLRAGRVDPTLDRFLVTAGIDPHFSSTLIEAAAQLMPFTHIPARLDYRIALSTINVQKRLSYDEADQIIESDPALYTLHRIAKQLRDARSNRGAITFRRAELKIRVKGDEIQITKINPNSPSRFVVSEM